MPEFDMVSSRQQRDAVRRLVAGEGLRVPIVYPFNIAKGTLVESYDPALDAAAEIGAEAINLLVFDADEARRAQSVAALCARAAERRLAVGLEFYPPSAVRSFDAALALADAAGAENLKLTIDLLHLRRSGSSLETVRAQRERILLAQVCDAPAAAPENLFHEAAVDRMLPGEGELDAAAFIHACGPDIPIAVEAPVQRLRHLPSRERARMALEATRMAAARQDGH